MFKIITLCFFTFITLFASDVQDCKSCHNIEDFDKKNHDFSCVQCHVLPQKRANFEHKDIITHPDNPKTVDTFCASCHQKDIHNVSHSLHTTLKGAISLTQELWGKKAPFDDIHSLKPQNTDVKEPKDLVDDFLARKCLKCHIGNQQSGEKGMARGQNCMACHIAYNTKGTYNGSDVTIQNKFPYANKHQLAKKPPMSACLSCHNKAFVGGDYLGLFPKDHDKSYRAPLTPKGLYPPKIYGSDYHYLSVDIHLKAGLTCTSCHSKDEVMGDGVEYEKQADAIKTTCKDCHQKLSYNEGHESYHENVSCSACHASWQMSNYELNVLLDKTKEYEKWKDLTRQEDGYLASFLIKALKAKVKPKPVMPNWINETMGEGIWYSGWRLRRWENLLLGNDEKGVVKALRPLFQYRISYKDANGSVVLNDISSIDGKKIEAFVPFTPHTIGKKARACEMCHENPLLGKDVQKTGTVLDLFSGAVKYGTPLSKKQIQKLSSKKYRNIRAKMLFDK